MAFLTNISRRSRKRIIIVAAIAVLLVVGGIVASFIFKPSYNPTANNNPQSSEESPFEPQISSFVAKTVVAANEAISKSKSVEDGVAVYQKAIKDTDSSDEKSALFVKQAEFLSAHNDNQSAIKAALEAQKIGGETLEITTMLATLYELVGDNPDAAIYYRKAADLLLKLPDNDDVGSDLKEEAAYYKDKATQLEGQE